MEASTASDEHRCRTSIGLRTPERNRKRHSRCVEAGTHLEEQVWQTKVSNAWVKHLPSIFRNRDTRKVSVFPRGGLDAPGRAFRCMGMYHHQDKLPVGSSGVVLRRRREDVPDADGLVCGPHASGYVPSARSAGGATHVLQHSCTSSNGSGPYCAEVCCFSSKMLTGYAIGANLRSSHHCTIYSWIC